MVIVFLLLWLGWKKLSTYELRQDWWAILTYSVVVFGVTQLVYLLSKYYFGEEGSIHIEVLLPAFVLGMVMKTRHVESRGERMAASGISFLFMFLVGLSMPLFIGMTAATGEACSFRDRFAAHDVVGRDRIPCGDRLVAVQPGQTFPDVFIVIGS